MPLLRKEERNGEIQEDPTFGAGPNEKEQTFHVKDAEMDSNRENRFSFPI